MHKIVVPNTILIVDDDEMNRDVLGNIFSASHSIEMAENGKECLNKILECGQKFCAVLLDVVMPVMGGIEVLKKLNRDGVVDHIPVFLITGETDTRIIKRAYELGVMDVISKPISSYMVQRRVNSVIELFTARKRLSSVVGQQKDQLLKQAAKVLATNTNYATMVSTPMNNSNKIKFIQLSMVDEEQVIAVIVLGGNVIKNNMIHVEKSLDDETLLKLNILLNTNLNGLPIEDINLAMITKLKQQAGIYDGIIAEVMDAVAAVIRENDDIEIYTSGANNIFKYPELSDNQSAQEIISAFEEKQQLSELVTQTLAQDENTGIQVYIGDEAPVKTMKDCSVVTATYELGEGMKGTIGIIGPKRMDYEHVMKTLKTLQSELDAIYNKEPKG